MKRLLRLLPLLLLVSAMTCWAQPAQAARLATLNGQADAAEVRESAEFRLADQDSIEITYDIADRGDNCSVQIRVYREHNGRWLVVNNVFSTNSSARGSRNLTLPAGNYRISVTATEARFNVTVDKP